jgi:pimeloyl-ACP methyl ester carboxylesterase
MICKIVIAVFVSALVSHQVFAADKPAEPEKYPFAVKVVGKGKPMIFIPGLACSGAVWNETVDHLKDHHECHLLTLAGFAGQSPLDGKAPYLETIRKGITAYIKAKQLDKPVIVGHSMGGVLVYALGAGEPDLVGPLVVVDSLPCFPAASNPKIDAKAMKAQADKMEKDLAAKPRDEFLKEQQQRFGVWFSDKDRLDKVYQWIADSDQATVARAFGELCNTDLRDDLAKIKTPLLVIAAYDKPYFEKIGIKRNAFEKIYEHQLAKVATRKIVITDEAKHFIMFDQPKWMWERMDEFLNAEKK